MANILHSKIFLIFGLVIAFLISISLGKEVYRKYQIQKEISAMEEEIKKIDSKNQDMSKMIEYFKSEAFLEVEARKKLNMKKPEEKVVIFTDDINKETIDTQTPQPNTNQESAPEAELANYQKWWGYFFDQTRD